MFDEFHGLPVHPLAVHAAVVLIPLSALLGLLFLVPRLRLLARWPLAAVTVAALVATYVSRESGQRLQEAIKPGGEAGRLVERHSELADQLFTMMIVFTVLVLVAALVVRPNARAALATGLALVVFIGAVVVSIWTYRVGELGSKAVWNPTGDQSYSAK